MIASDYESVTVTSVAYGQSFHSDMDSKQGMLDNFEKLRLNLILFQQFTRTVFPRLSTGSQVSTWSQMSARSKEESMITRAL